MTRALLFLFHLSSHKSLHLAKGIASNCCHARVKAFIINKLSLPHPLVEVGPVLPPCIKKNPRIYLEKNTENKKPQTYEMFEKS